MAKSSQALPDYKAKCLRILNSVTSLRLDVMHCLSQPVNPAEFPDYAEQIPHPIDFSTIEKKLGTKATSSKLKAYESHNEFALDVRRICGNFYRFNSLPADKPKRSQILQIFNKFEKLWKEMQEEAEENTKTRGYYFSFPPENIVAVIEALENTFLVDGVVNFWFPMKVYMDKKAIKDYLSVVKTPVDISTMTSNIFEAHYSSVVQIVGDFDLIVSNCETYWSKRPGGSEYIDQSRKIRNEFVRSFTEIVYGSAMNSLPESAVGFDLHPMVSSTVAHPAAKPAEVQPTAGNAGGKKRKSSTVNAVADVASKELFHDFQPPKFLLGRVTISFPSGGSLDHRIGQYLRETFKKCLEETKKHVIVSQLGIRVQTARPFLVAVNPSDFPDYATIVTNPMDFAKMERKLSTGRYPTVRSILDDMALLRHNAHLYNVGTDGIEVRIMADQVLHFFRYCVKAALFHLYEERGKSDDVWKEVAGSLERSEDERLLSESVPEDVNVYLQLMVKEGAVASTEPLSLVANESKAKSTKSFSSPTPKLKATASVEPDLVPVHPTETKSGKKTSSAAKHQKPAPSEQQSTDFTFEEVVVPARDRPSWELAADNVLRAVEKHAYVDTTKSSVIANFFDRFSATDDVAESLNLRDLKENLLYGAIPDPETFNEKICLIFQRVVDHYEPFKDQSFAVKLIRKCSHLVQYVKWICLEYLPVKQESSGEDAEKGKRAKRDTDRVSSYALTDIVQLNERALREQLLDSINLRESGQSRDPVVAGCQKLLKDVERTRNKQEQNNLSFFMVPVDEKLLADYFMHIRKPIDLGTIRTKLESTGIGKYQNCSQFVADLRRVFTNAIKYNGLHRETDPTGWSQRVYDAAVALQQKVESLTPMFTVDIIDRYERLRIHLEDEGVKEREAALRIEQTRQSLVEFEKEQLERLKATDKAYALDLDAHAKKLKTRREIQASALVQWKKRLRQERIDAEASPEYHNGGDDMLEDDEDHEMRIAGYQEDAEYGEDGDYFANSVEYLVVPQRFASFAKRKQAVRERAWKRRLPLASQSNLNLMGPETMPSDSKALKLSLPQDKLDQSLATETCSEIDYSSVRFVPIVLKRKVVQKRNAPIPYLLIDC